MEIFAGVESVKKAAEEECLEARSIDKDIDEVNHDLTTEHGFLYLIAMIIMVARSGLTWIAPVCSSMGFPNTRNTKRTKETPDGDPLYQPNQIGKNLALVAAAVVQLCHLRGVHWVIENPRGSFIFVTSYLQPTLQYVRHWRVTTAMCAFSHGKKKKIMKPLTLVGSHTWILNMKRLCSCSAGHLQTMPLNVKGKPCGSAAFKLSQAYSPTFGRHVVKYFLEATGATTGSRQVSEPLSVSWQMAQVSDDDNERSNDFDNMKFGEGFEEENQRMTLRKRDAWMMQQDSDSD